MYWVVVFGILPPAASEVEGKADLQRHYMQTYRFCTRPMTVKYRAKPRSKPLRRIGLTTKFVHDWVTDNHTYTLDLVIIDLGMKLI